MQPGDSGVHQPPDSPFQPLPTIPGTKWTSKTCDLAMPSSRTQVPIKGKKHQEELNKWHGIIEHNPIGANHRLPTEPNQTTATTWKCTECSQTMSENNTQAHFDSQDHQNVLRKGDGSVNPEPGSSAFQTNVSEPSTKPVQSKVNAVRAKASPSHPRARPWTCIICSSTMSAKDTNSHVTGAAHKRALSNETKNPRRQTQQIPSPRTGRRSSASTATWKCTTCLREMCSKDIEAHMNGKEHQSQTKQAFPTNSSLQEDAQPSPASTSKPSTSQSKWTCTACFRTMADKDYEAHLKSGDHRRALSNIDDKSQPVTEAPCFEDSCENKEVTDGPTYIEYLKHVSKLPKNKQGLRYVDYLGLKARQRKPEVEKSLNIDYQDSLKVQGGVSKDHFNAVALSLLRMKISDASTPRARLFLPTKSTKPLKEMTKLVEVKPNVAKKKQQSMKRKQIIGSIMDGPISPVSSGVFGLHGIKNGKPANFAGYSSSSAASPRTSTSEKDPLELFFDGYPPFKYNKRQPSYDEFRRLCKSFNWASLTMMSIKKPGKSFGLPLSRHLTRHSATMRTILRAGGGCTHYVAYEKCRIIWKVFKR